VAISVEIALKNVSKEDGGHTHPSYAEYPV
jgi:hypothetical protein